MFFDVFFLKKQRRQFKFTTYYYKEPDYNEKDDTKPRIQFRQIRRGVILQKKAVRIKIFLLVLLLFFLYYFWGMINQDNRTFQLEDIKIEQAPSNY